MTSFWVDLIAYGSTAVIALVLMLIVLGAGIRRRINLTFALLMLTILIWSATAVTLRISLWRVTRATLTQQFWMEISTFTFMLMAPLLLAFSAVYTQTKARWPYWVVAITIGLIALSAWPLFQHQLIYNIRLGYDGTLIWNRTPLSFVTSLPLAINTILALVLLWSERQRTKESILFIAFSLLFLSATVFSLWQLPFPTLSVATLLVVVLVGYAILNRQVFNPLRELTQELERRVEERTRELVNITAQFEEANRNLARRTAQLEAASFVARHAAAIRDVPTLLEETVRLISDRFGFYHAGIFLVDELGEYAVLRAASSEGGQRMLARGHKLAIGEVGIVGYVAKTGKPHIALDVGTDAVFFDNPDLPHTRSEMALPLKVGDRVLGVLDIQSVEPAAFTQEDVAILQTMADQVALAIENNRLLEEAQDRLREVTALSREYALREWEQLVSRRPGWGYIYDGVEVKPGEEPMGEEDSSILTIPLQIGGGETVGRLRVALPSRTPGPEEIALAQAVAEQAALALESARLFQETQRTLRQMEMLYRASQAISTAATPDDILHAFTDHLVTPEIGRCVLALLDPLSPPDNPIVEIVAAWEPGVDRPAVLGNRWNIRQIPLIAHMPPDPLFVSDVMTDPIMDERSRYIFREVLGIHAFAAIPLLAAENLLGWLLVESLTGMYEFSEEEKSLYPLLARQAAVALERMRLFEETRRRAELERLRAEVSARVRASTDMDTILRTAVRELGRALRATEGVIQLHAGDGRSGTEEQRG